MSDLKYTEEHEWVRVEGEEAVVGISDFAQQALGDVVFVELPDVGKALSKGDEAAVVESVKAASEVYAPLDGEVAAVNEALLDDPAQINADPTGAGWFFKIKVADSGQLELMMDAEAYTAFAKD